MCPVEPLGAQPVARVGDDPDPAGDPQVAAQRRDVLRRARQRVEGADHVDRAGGQGRLRVRGHGAADHDRGRPGAHDPLDGLDAAARPGRGRAGRRPAGARRPPPRRPRRCRPRRRRRSPGADSRPRRVRVRLRLSPTTTTTSGGAVSPVPGMVAPGCWPVIDMGADRHLPQHVGRRANAAPSPLSRRQSGRRHLRRAGRGAVRGSPRSCRRRRCTLRSWTGTPGTPATCPGGRPGTSAVGGAGQRGHAPADPGRPGRAGLPGLAGALADARRRWPPSRRARRCGPGAGSATRGGRCGCTRPRPRWWRGTAASCRRRTTGCSPLPGRRRLHRGRRRVVRARRPARGAGHQRAPGAGPGGRRRRAAGADAHARPSGRAPRRVRARRARRSRPAGRSR